MANPAVASLLTAAPSSPLKAAAAPSPEAAGSQGSGTEKGPFASVLESKVKTPAPETQADAASSTAGQSESARQPEAANALIPIDLSALLPMIAAQLAAIAGSEAPAAAVGAADPSGSVKAGIELAAALPTALSAGPANPAATTAEDGQFALPGAESPAPRAEVAHLAAGDEKAVAQLVPRPTDTMVDLPTADAKEVAAAEPALPAHAASPTREVGDHPALKLDTPVNSPRWSEALAEKVVWVAQRNENRAELVLTPASLGRIEVTVTHSPNGETSVMFVAANPDARDALEQSLPRLREILGDAGISLGQAGVSAESSPRNGEGESGARRQSGEGETHVDGVIAAVPLSVKLGLGVVDTFA